MAKWGIRVEWLGILGACGLALALANACGNSGKSSHGTTKDSGADTSSGGSGGAAGGGSGGGGGQCLAVGKTCTNSANCCSANCDAKLQVCAKPVGCKSAGDACSSATDCCTGVCTNGKCGSTHCTYDNQPCTANADCCGGNCAVGPDGGPKVCIPLNPNCATSPNKCATNADCCSGVCKNGVCDGNISYCRQTGDSCSKGADCCGGICTIASGKTLGTCAVPQGPGAGGCHIAGTVCDPTGATACGDSFCCSHSCAPYGPTGVNICQPPSGCRPTGEVCAKDSDCCGATGNPDSEANTHCSKANPTDKLGLCDQGHKCSPAGSICRLQSMSCSATDVCCAGNVQQNDTCHLDLLGIPRCTIKPGGCKGDAGSMAGQACASSADCCGLPCVPNKAGSSPPFICGPSCVPQGGNCSTDADCCSGLPCTTPPGSSTGKCEQPPPPPQDAGTTDSGTKDGGTNCALYGQTCKVNSDCCNGVPCTGGRCVVIIQ